jgi:hypothetical protein
LTAVRGNEAQLAGFYLLDAPDSNAAIEAAAQRSRLEAEGQQAGSVLDRPFSAG